MSPANLANLLGALAAAVADDVRVAGEDAGQDPTAAAALAVLTKYPSASIQELRGALSLTHSGCVRMVDRLGDAGLVERRDGADARSVALQLTRKGRAAADELTARRERALRSALVGLSDTEQQTLGRLLFKVLEARLRLGGDTPRVCRQCDYAVCAECPAVAANS